MRRRDREEGGSLESREEPDQVNNPAKHVIKRVRRREWTEYRADHIFTFISVSHTLFIHPLSSADNMGSL